jgi:hypothetical protein
VPAMTPETDSSGGFSNQKDQRVDANGPTGCSKPVEIQDRLIETLSIESLPKSVLKLLVSLLFDYTMEDRSRDVEIFEPNTIACYIHNLTGVNFTADQIRNFLFVQLGPHCLASIAQGGKAGGGMLWWFGPHYRIESLITMLTNAQTWESWDHVRATLGIDQARVGVPTLARRGSFQVDFARLFGNVAGS